ncbi:FadR/GntR family transcriptional regulator [Rhizobium sp. LC145]|uniref:FadR/GntR family transcriptional regulator n=1 Tax=Rhizobium sp. LC145 TaxID=1120688 RepID=UPI0010C9C798|nr:FadR/GntR family transcriptional regulator [Rhizobium sp. LC145]TKT46724.1 FadR family transcriptional regulator [Rhizobiaceae bacterium LC148]
MVQVAEGSASNNSVYALDKLRELLQAGELTSDGRLPTERALAEMLGIGRRAVRRALEVLEAEGSVWRRQGAGTFVGERPSDWDGQLGRIVAGTDFLEIMEVRLRVEPQLAQLAALRAKPRDVEKMREICRKITESDDADAKELWDGAFHRQIAQSAGNQLFLTVFDVINRVREDDAWQVIRERARSSRRDQNVIHVQHERIVEAIAARDPARAGEAMREHLLGLQEVLIRVTSMEHEELNPLSETG